MRDLFSNFITFAGGALLIYYAISKNDAKNTTQINNDIKTEYVSKLDTKTFNELSNTLYIIDSLYLKVDSLTKIK